jgi:hypothetical protein
VALELSERLRETGKACDWRPVTGKACDQRFCSRHEGRDLGMKIIAAETITDLLARAASAPRKRMNLNLHAEPSDPTNRFLNAGLAGTYVRPHRHRIG